MEQITRKTNTVIEQKYEIKSVWCGLDLSNLGSVRVVEACKLDSQFYSSIKGRKFVISFWNRILLNKVNNCACFHLPSSAPCWPACVSQWLKLLWCYCLRNYTFRRSIILSSKNQAQETKTKKPNHVITETEARAEQRENCDSIPGRVDNFPFVTACRSVPGSHPASSKWLELIPHGM